MKPPRPGRCKNEYILMQEQFNKVPRINIFTGIISGMRGSRKFSQGGGGGGGGGSEFPEGV